MAADENIRDAPTGEERRFLEQLLADYRRANLPGSEAVMRMIEKRLAGLPLSSDAPELPSSPSKA